MDQIAKAIAEGRCALAVSGALLRDAKIVLALADRAALHPMTLTGPAVPPVESVSDQGLARAIGQKKGLLVVVDPQSADLPGITELAARLKSAPFKPEVVLVSRKLDFMLQAAFMGLKTHQVKERAQAFLAALPVPPAEAEAPVPDVPKPAAAKGGLEAPGALCVGRDDVLATLAGILAEGGPTVVSGPPGIGRRTVIEAALAATELARQPDVFLDRDTGFDTLIGRLAMLQEAAGQGGLKQALADHATPPALVAAAVAGQAAEGLAGHALVVHGLEEASGRDGAFFRTSRLAMLVEALLTTPTPLRLLFTAGVQPVFYREGRDAPLHRLALTGIKGREYHGIFEALHAPEFPRDKFGPLSERLHGHPLAVRLVAAAMRHHPELIDDDKAFSLSGPDDLKGIGKIAEKRIKALSEPMRRALIAAAHLRDAGTGRTLAELEVSRKQRDALILDGLLTVVGGEGKPRRYYVPDNIKHALGRRDTSDFNTMAALARILLAEAEGAEPLVAFALKQEANRLLEQSRRGKDAVDLGVPDFDAILDNATGMIRTKGKPNHELAGRALRFVLDRDPANADAWLLELERLRAVDAPFKDRKAVLEEAIDKAPVPELFHDAVGLFRSQGNHHEAIAVLEKGVELLPEHSRLRCRLASLQYRQGRRHDAIQHLEQAMALDPMLPDAYGLLGTIRAEEGALSVDRAEDLLREAVRLAPDDIVQTARLVRLLLDIAEGVPARREAVRAEIRERLDALHAVHKEDWEVHLLYAEALRAEGKDPEKAAWFLGKARKLAPNRRGVDRRFKLESARLDLARGKVDEVERTLKDLARKDPSNAEVVQLLAEVHASRGHLVAAHAELSRAIDRMSPHALERTRAETRLAELATQIQQAAGAFPAPPPADAASAADPTPAEATEDAAPLSDAPPAPAEAEASVDGSSEPAEAAPVAESTPAADEPPATHDEIPNDDPSESSDAVAPEGEPLPPAGGPVPGDG